MIAKPSSSPKREEASQVKKPSTKKGSRPKAHLATTWRHLRRSPYQALAAIVTLTISLSIASIFIIAAAGASTVIRFFEAKPQVTAFFVKEPTEKELQILIDRLRRVGQVSNINFVSQEQALEIYREMNKDEPLLLEMVTANILPASLEVSMVDPENLTAVAEALREENNVEEVVFQREVVESLSTWAKSLRTAGLALVGSLAVVSFLVILVVIGMKISTHRMEIEILQLIGATPVYTGLPFVMEGMTYGLVGGFLAWGVAYTTLLYTTPFLVGFLKGIPVLPVPWEFMAYLLAGNLGVGLVWGGLASWAATQRFLARKKGLQ